LDAVASVEAGVEQVARQRLGFRALEAIPSVLFRVSADFVVVQPLGKLGKPQHAVGRDPPEGLHIGVMEKLARIFMSIHKPADPVGKSPARGFFVNAFRGDNQVGPVDRDRVAKLPCCPLDDGCRELRALPVVLNDLSDAIGCEIIGQNSLPRTGKRCDPPQPTSAT
jgi:hypothetical protein